MIQEPLPGTRLDIQDTRYREQGFHPYQDYPLFSNDLEGTTSVIIKDGGEIRTDHAYEEDETTIKQGWTRLYWK